MTSQSNVTLISGAVAWPFGYPGTSNPIRLAEIKSPSHAVAMLDLDQQDASSYAGVSTVPLTGIHAGRRNCLFFDGHVEALTTIPTSQ